MFGGSKRDEWGPEGLQTVNKSHQIYLEISALIKEKRPPKLETVSYLIPKFDDIDTARFAYSAKWADTARTETKNGGSFTMLFLSTHFISQSAKELWVCYVLETIEPENRISADGFELYRGAAENCWENCRRLPQHSYRMTQTEAISWWGQMDRLFVNSDIGHEIWDKALNLDAVPEQWFPDLNKFIKEEKNRL